MTMLPYYPDVPPMLWIGGAWCQAQRGGSFPVQDPATGETLAMVHSATEDDVTMCVAAATDSASQWASTAPRDRAEILRTAFSIMLSESEILTKLIVRENGKTLADARGEVAYAAEFLRWYSEEACRIDGLVRRSPRGENWIVVLQQPVGLALLITPWNFPAAMATRKIGPALAAGCPVILKPARETPLTALAIADVFHRAGLPAGVLNVLPTDDASGTVSAAFASGRVRKLSFTGSTEVGALLLRQAAEGVVSCSMELGGNAPFLVLADAEIEKAAQAALVAKMRNGGASCIAANRFIVAEAVAEEFTARLSELLAGLRMGPGLDPETRVAPLVSTRERAKVAAAVLSGLEGGARAVLGGTPGDGTGAFYPATVLADVHPGNPLLETEVFGPVAPITTVSGDDEAVALANATEMGLAGYVMTENLGRGMAVAEALQVGVVGLNRGFISDPAAPFGGIKQSGIGREGSHEGLLAFLEQKYIAVEW
jgi:succinate-semialdehyde dehydrogenase / glutarate-semialdehyde dehydrogenase